MESKFVFVAVFLLGAAIVRVLWSLWLNKFRWETFRHALHLYDEVSYRYAQSGEDAYRSMYNHAWTLISKLFGGEIPLEVLNEMRERHIKHTFLRFGHVYHIPLPDGKAPGKHYHLSSWCGVRGAVPDNRVLMSDNWELTREEKYEIELAVAELNDNPDLPFSMLYPNAPSEVGLTKME